MPHRVEIYSSNHCDSQLVQNWVRHSESGCKRKNLTPSPFDWTVFWATSNCDICRFVDNQSQSTITLTKHQMIKPKIKTHRPPVPLDQARNNLQEVCSLWNISQLPKTSPFSHQSTLPGKVDSPVEGNLGGWQRRWRGRLAPRASHQLLKSHIYEERNVCICRCFGTA